MEAPLLVKMADSILVAAALLYLLLLRPWRPARLVRRLVPGVDLLFVLGLASGAAALHAQAPFDRLAIFVVDESGLPETLSETDARIEAIEQLPARLWRELRSRLGWLDEEPAAPPGPAPSPGPVSEVVLPAVNGVVEVLLRAFTYWSALLLLASAQAMRLLAGLAARRAELAAGRAGLESRVQALEAALARLQTPLLLAPQGATGAGA